MMIQAAQNNQINFNGRAFVVSGPEQPLRKAIKQINSMKSMRNANFNLYIGQSAFFPRSTCVIAAKDKNFINAIPRENTTGRISNGQVSAIIETAKTVIAEHSEKLAVQNKKHNHSTKKYVIL